MQPALANLIVCNRQMGKTAEQSQEIYEAIGRGVMGFGKGLKAIGIEMNPLMQRVLKMNAEMGQYAQNAIILVRETMRQHGGAFAEWMRTLPGQAIAAVADTQLAMKQIGDSMLPMQQMVQITVGKLLPVLVPPIVRLANIVSTHFAEWVRLIDSKVVPAFKKLVRQGWDFLNKAIVWFQHNSKWFIPWITEAVKAIGLWTFVLGPLAQGIVLVKNALIALSLANPWAVIAIASGVAAYAVITDWMGVKKHIADFWEWMVGSTNFTSTFAPKALPKGSLRQIQKALPLEPGLITRFADWIETIRPIVRAKVRTWLDETGTALDTGFKGWLVTIGQSWDAAFLKWIKDASATIKQWLFDTGKAWDDTASKWFDPLIAGLRRVGDALQDYVINPWQRFFGGGGGGSRPGGTGSGSGINWLKGYLGNTTLPRPPPNAAGYVGYEEYPWEGHSSNYGPSGNHLILGKGVGLGVNVQKQWGVQQGDWVNQGGGYGWRQINEASSRKWGVEMYTNRVGSVPGRIPILGVMRNSDMQGMKRMQSAPAVASPLPSLHDMSKDAYKHLDPATRARMQEMGTAPVTINYSPTYHINAGSMDDLKRHLATEHRRHIDELKNDLAQILCENRRSSLVNASGFA
jgi:hypothetical protein